MPSPPLSRRAIAGVFGLALAVRLLHIASIRDAPFFTIPMGDGAGYDTWAREIAAGNWIGDRVFYQSPLYPYVLGALYAVVGPSPWVARLLQAFLGAGACVLLAGATARWFSARAGLIAGLILAFYAPAIFFDGLIQKAELDLFLLCLVLWILARIDDGSRTQPPTWLGLGLATGALALSRENALLLAILVLWLAFQVPRVHIPRRTSGAPGSAGGPGSPHNARRAGIRPRVRRAGFCLAGMALVLLPVTLRNVAVSGEFHLTTSQFGPNFYIGNHEGANGTYQPLRPGRGEAAYERTDAIQLAEAARGRSLSPGEVSRFWTERALAYIRSQPGNWLRLMGRKFVLLWNAEELEDTEDLATHATWSLPLKLTGLAFHFGTLFPLAVLGACMYGVRRRPLPLLYAFAAVYAASVLVFYVLARYRFPLVPLLVVLAAAGIADARRYWIGASGTRRIAAVIAVIIAGVATNWPVVRPEAMAVATNLNIGKALQSRGELVQATEYYRAALRLDPGYAAAHNNLGSALAAQGDPAGALEHYAEAIRLRPDYAEAHYNRGLALGTDGDLAGAIASLEEARRLDPYLPDVDYQLGALQQAAGHLNESIQSYRRLLATNPAHVEGHYNLGVAFATTGALDSAIVYFRHALELKPDLAAARQNLAVAERMRAGGK